MNDAQRARLLQDLLAERETLARRWYKVLWQNSWERKEEAAARYFVPLVERFLTLLLGPADPEAERGLGSELAAWCEVPEELLRSQELLTRYLGDQLSAKETRALQPRLVRLFGEMATGFFAAKAERKPSLLAHFFDRAGHSLITPLSDVLGFSRVILRGIDGPLTDLQHRDLTRIHNSGQILLQEIDSFRDLHKIEAGKLEINAEEFELERLVACFRLPGMTSREQHLEVSCDESNRTIYGDPVRIRQVVLTLLSHISRRAGQGSKIQLIVTRTIVDETTWLAIQIISPGPFAGLFDPSLSEYQHLFAQGMELANVISPRCELSAVLAHLLTRLMGGRIEVEEKKGRGSTVTATFPIDKPEEPEEETVRPLVLMLDDEPPITRLYERYLTAEGYRAISYNNPRRLIEDAPKLDAQLILVDLQMPEMDGFEVMRALRLHPKTRNVPTILCSTQPIEEIEQQGLEEGTCDFLQKPAIRLDLIALVQRWTGVQPKSTGGATP